MYILREYMEGRGYLYQDKIRGWSFTVWWKIPAVGEASATNVSCTLKAMVLPQCFGKSLNCVEWKNKIKMGMLAPTVYIHRDRSCIFLFHSVFWILVYCSICLSCLVWKQVVINRRWYEWLLYKWLRKEKVFSMFLIFLVYLPIFTILNLTLYSIPHKIF